MGELCRRSWLHYHPGIDRVIRGEQRWTVEHTDCLVALRAMGDCSVDAVVTDPPYELGFMSKAWDKSGIAFRPDVWREALRVLKPGGHLLAFGGTRTVHRIACAIEDAGFDIRDSIAWMHGQGFPKSLDLSKQADKIEGFWRGRAGAVHSAAAAAAAAAGFGTALKPSFEPIIVARKPLAGTVADNFAQHGTGGLNIDACRVAHAGATDLAAHEAQVAALKSKGGSLGNCWKNTSDLAGANDVNTAGRWPPNALFSHDPCCVRLGTAEVPANPTWDTQNRQTEPSKFTGAVVSSVRHGEASAERRYSDRGVTGMAPLPGARRDAVESVEQWRCVDGCAVRELSIQSGDLGTSAGMQRTTSASWLGTRTKDCDKPIGFSDSGSAARFFPQFHPDQLDDITPFLYQAKPSTGERDAGLHHFRTLTGGEATGREDGSAGTQSPRAGAGRNGGRRNHHATVKPVDLMRWLIRLVTPPGGVCLDPFAGSGSGGVAALLEGVRWIGMELNDDDDEPSVSVARARISWTEGREVIPRESLRAKDPPRQRGLFEVANG